ncbi:MAG: uncharacterized protein QOD48_725 [Gaiellaceae bacterium]|nr:uncharacterized protein [Gaiellaceae bacterium]
MNAGFGSKRGIHGLSPEELRVLGCLLEKQRTTPDQYPLSLNALRLACNQSTNREPVVDYDEATVRDALHRLERRRLVRFTSGSRTAKYRHLLEEVLPLDDGERAVLAVLMLRDAQTPGELKQRTERMHAFANLAGVHDTLARLIERELVRRLDRRPGQKEERYAQLLGGADATGDGELDDRRHGAISEHGQVGAHGPVAAAPDLDGLAELRARVERLEREVAALRTMRNPSPSAPSDHPHEPLRTDPRV